MATEGTAFFVGFLIPSLSSEISRRACHFILLLRSISFPLFVFNFTSFRKVLGLSKKVLGMQQLVLGCG